MRTSSRLGLAAAIAAASLHDTVLAAPSQSTHNRPTPAKDRARAVRVTETVALKMEITAHNAAIEAKRQRRKAAASRYYKEVMQ